MEDVNPDHDWTARFFGEVQDVTNEDMQFLWAKVLAGEVVKAGSTSLRTLSILRNLDQQTAILFKKLCSLCIYGDQIGDARALTLNGPTDGNGLATYGLVFRDINILHENGLVIPTYNSWRDYRISVGVTAMENDQKIRLPFRHQNAFWYLHPTNGAVFDQECRLYGIALTLSGRELSSFVGVDAAPQYTLDLTQHFESTGFVLEQATQSPAQVFSKNSWKDIDVSIKVND